MLKGMAEAQEERKCGQALDLRDPDHIDMWNHSMNKKLASVLSLHCLGSNPGPVHAS
jgi:hypothetical protein